MNQQLQDYIKQAKELGKSDDQIRQELLSNGWSAKDIEEIMLGVNEEKNVLETMLNKKATFPEETSNQQPIKSLSKLSKLPKIIIVVSIVLVGFVGGYFALSNYFPQYAKYIQPYVGPVLDPVVDSVNSLVNSLPFIGGAPYSSENILKAFEKTVLIDSAKYKSNLNIETQDRDPNLKPLIVKIPKGEVPDDLKKVITTYDYASEILKTGDIKNDEFVIVDLSELKPAMDDIAEDRAKIKLATSILSDLRYYYDNNQRDPALISELSGNTYNKYTDWSPLEGKYFTYLASPDLKSFKLVIILKSTQSVEGIKSQIENCKKTSYCSKDFNEGSIVFDGNKVIFNEKSIRFASNLYYLTIGSQSFIDQISSIFSDNSYDDYLSYIPGRFKINLNLGGIMQSKDSKSFYIRLGGKADFEDLVVEADFEFTNTDKESFLKINKFPSIFMDVSKIREEWIKLSIIDNPSTYSDADYYSSYASSIQEYIAEYRDKSDRQLAQLRKLASIAEKEKIITAIGSPIKENINDQTVYKYLVTIDENKLPIFYERAAVDLKEYGDEALVQGSEMSKLFFNSNGFKEIVRYLKDVSDFYIWVDSSGYIVKFQYNLKYVPNVISGDQISPNKQFYISGDLELSEINKNLDVEKPIKYIEWKDAISKLFGVTLDSAQMKARNAKRIADINQLRTAAELYFDDNGEVYPKELSLENLNIYFNSSEMPKDPSTGKEYNYAYSPADRPTKYHVWTELESSSDSYLGNDADINSDLSSWVGDKINASQDGSESCSIAFNNGLARDCIYDQGTK